MTGIGDEALLLVHAFDHRADGPTGKDVHEQKDQQQTGERDDKGSGQKGHAGLHLGPESTKTTR